tara:strand:+ start:1839 stop:2642 length:804 start_codon:yes stop_codon:yes gene_type:complete
MSRLLSLVKQGRRAVVGMVQLPALPGGANYRAGTIEAVIDAARSEAEILGRNGIDALMVQNLGDIPVHHKTSVEQVAWMTRVTSEIVAAASCPVGLNFLENDAHAMMAVASASGADFVRIKIYVGAMLTPFGIESAQAHVAIKARTALRADKVAILADVHDRTGTPIATGGFEEDVEFALRLGLADGLVLTGKSYQQTLDMVGRARAQYPKAPLFVGGGVTSENFAEAMAEANGAFVSTAMKDSGSAVGRFVPQKVQDFMAAARRSP